jgi:hypothetical protein
MYKEKIDILLSKIKSLPNNQATQHIDHIDRLLTLASKYTTATAEFNWVLDLLKQAEQKEHEQRIAQFNKIKDDLYTELDKALFEANRIFTEFGMDKIYNGNSGKEGIINFAQNLTNEYFIKRRK